MKQSTLSFGKKSKENQLNGDEAAPAPAPAPALAVAPSHTLTQPSSTSNSSNQIEMEPTSKTVESSSSASITATTVASLNGNSTKKLKSQTQGKLNFVKKSSTPSSTSNSITPSVRSTSSTTPSITSTATTTTPASLPPSEEPELEPASKRPRRSKEATTRPIPSGLTDLSKVDLEDYESRVEDLEENKREKAGKGRYNSKNVNGLGTVMEDGETVEKPMPLSGLGGKDKGKEKVEGKRRRKMESNKLEAGVTPLAITSLALERTDSRASSNGSGGASCRLEAIDLDDDEDEGVGQSKPKGKGKVQEQQIGNSVNQSKASTNGCLSDGIEFVSSSFSTSDLKKKKQKAVSNSGSISSTSNPKPTIAQTGLQVKGTLEKGKDVPSFFQKRTKVKEVESYSMSQGESLEGTSSNKRGSMSTSSSFGKIKENKKKLEAAWPTRENGHVQPSIPTEERSSTASNLRPIHAFKSTSKIGLVGKGKSRAIDSESGDGRNALASLIGFDSRSLENLLNRDEETLEKERFPEPSKSNVYGFLKSEILQDRDEATLPASILKLSTKVKNGETKLRPHLNRSILLDASLSSPPADELWTSKYKPRKADEVLGNEGNSLYLKEWLKELIVEKKVVKSLLESFSIKNLKESGCTSKNLQETMSKKRKLMKGLESKRGKRRKEPYGSADDDPLDDWIADDDDEEDQGGEDAIEDSEFDGDAWMMEIDKAKEEEDRKRKRKKNILLVESEDEDEGNETKTQSGPDSLKKAIAGISRPGDSSELGQENGVAGASRNPSPATEFTSHPPSQEIYSSYYTSNSASKPNLNSSAFSSSSIPSAPLYSNSSHLTNLIILTGPIGSGKSASVYAVAEELGYDVFELNPGAKRGNKELLHEVGEVGRNHQVGGGGNRFMPSSSSSSTKANAFQHMFAAAEKLKAEEKKSTSTQQPKGGTKLRQSLILIEEADIVFEQDVGFWKGLEVFLKTCNRPVVVTCNDLDFIRTWTLAIQEILYYRSPPPSIANPYLQLIALSEGHLLTSKQVSTIYDSTSLPLKSHSSLQPFPSNGPLHVFSNFTSQDTVEPQLDLHAEGVENGKSRDFRKAIIQIQFWCQWAVGFDRMPLARRRKGEEKWLEDEGNGIWSRDSMIGSGILGEDEGDEEMNSKSTQTLEGSEAEYLKMKEASYKADLSSMINSDFQRSFSRASEIFEPDAYKTSLDEEVPVQFMHQFYKVAPSSTSPTSAQKGLEESLTATLRELSATQLDEKLEQREEMKFNIQRLYHSRLARTLLLNLGLSPSHYVPSQSTLVDYAPCVRRIVQFDNLEAEKFSEKENIRIAEILEGESHQEQVGTGAFNLGGLSALAMVGRGTRNSSRRALVRREYNRWCKVDEEGARAAEKSGFELESPDEK